MFELAIRKMPDGGYLVSPHYNNPGSYNAPAFASTTIEEALKYIKAQLEPKQPK